MTAYFRTLILLLCLATALPAAADDMADHASRIASADFGVLKAAIEQLGQLQDPRALTILEALEQKQLRSLDGKLFVQGASGQTIDPLTGSTVALPAGATKPTVNNRMRRVLRGSLAQLRLRSEDLETRRTAAEVIAKSPSAEIGPMLRQAHKTEKDPETRLAMGRALAQLDLSSDKADQRLAAVQILSQLGDPAYKPQLELLLARADDGSFREPDEGVRAAAQTALSKIESKQFFTRILRDFFYGMSLGSVLLLAALGLAITFGLMGVINMAHGEMIMIGAYCTFFIQTLFQEHAPGALDWYLAASVPTAFLFCMAVGVLMERLVIRHLYGRPLETLLATWGISLILIQTVRMVFGAQNVAVANPSYLSGGYEILPGVVLPYARLATVAFVTIVVTFVWYLLNRTNLGLQVRAITQNRQMARCMGIRTNRVDMLTFGLGSGVAGLGGVALSQLGNVGPELGQGYIVDSFMVVVVGGVGKLVGTVVAAMGLGLVNKVLEPLSGAVLGKIFVLAFIILFIQRRPQGLFALKGRSVEG